MPREPSSTSPEARYGSRPPRPAASSRRSFTAVVSGMTTTSGRTRATSAATAPASAPPNSRLSARTRRCRWPAACCTDDGGLGCCASATPAAVAATSMGSAARSAARRRTSTAATSITAAISTQTGVSACRTGTTLPMSTSHHMRAHSAAVSRHASAMTTPSTRRTRPAGLVTQRFDLLPDRSSTALRPNRALGQLEPPFS